MSKTLLAIIATVPLSGPAHSEQLTGQAVDVHDGDTLTLQVSTGGRAKVRLAGIDAPELRQPYGQQSREALIGMVIHQTLTVDVSKSDRYGRSLGMVYVGSTNVNAALVESGAAWVYRDYPFPPSFEGLESQAKASQKGLWALPVDQRCPPWDFRRSRCTITSAQDPVGVCGLKTKCKEMASCDEAKYYLTQCGVQSLDGNGDGVPCTSLCR